MTFDYSLIRSNRKTVSIQVNIDGSVVVRAPNKLPLSEIEKIVSDKRNWIEKTIVSQKEKQKGIKEYSAEEIAFLRKKAKEIIPEKVKYYSQIMHLEPNSVKITSAKKRYGSCSGRNNLNFSLYLMDKDERLIDYVVVHELAHIKHHNHSKDFYKLVERYIPDYKELDKL